MLLHGVQHPVSVISRAVHGEGRRRSNDGEFDGHCGCSGGELPHGLLNRAVGVLTSRVPWGLHKVLDQVSCPPNAGRTQEKPGTNRLPLRS